MSMTPIYGEPSEPEAIATIHGAVARGREVCGTRYPEAMMSRVGI